MKSKRERKLAVAQRRAQLNSVGRVHTLNPVQAYGPVVGGMMLYMRLLARKVAKRELARARRREVAARLAGSRPQPSATQLREAEARDQLRYDRIEQGFKYERNGSADRQVYAAQPNIQHSGQKRAKDAAKVDTSKVRVRAYDPRAFDSKTGGFGKWKRVEYTPTIAPSILTEHGLRRFRNTQLS